VGPNSTSFNIRLSARGQKPAFRDAWSRGQRCLVVTDGFYEWKKLDAKGKLKQPYAIAVTDNEAQMVMAGLWAKWKSPTSGEEVLSCTILTCGPNKVMGELHDRMPVILAENDWPKWLGEEPASEQDLLALLKPCPDEALKIWPVDKMVGNVRNNGPQLILPVNDSNPLKVCSALPMTRTRRFPTPWSVDDIGGCFVVKASNNRALVFIYYGEGVARRSLAKLLTRNAARRIAVGIAKLPELIAEGLICLTKIKVLPSRQSLNCFGGN
jgi:putative SOS response-associated peptidase YedK